jgi:L-lactate dehydrogenase complex protein LldG
VPAAELSDTLASVITEPAVGVSLPYDTVDLEALGVTTSPTTGDLQAATTGVTPVPYGIADYGSIIVRSNGEGVEPISLFAETHVAVLAESDIHETMASTVDTLGEDTLDGAGDNVIATGPSATADMGSLVYGAHGPYTVHVIIVEDR